jgi:hypothetical protein
MRKVLADQIVYIDHSCILMVLLFRRQILIHLQPQRLQVKYLTQNPQEVLIIVKQEKELSSSNENL